MTMSDLSGNPIKKEIQEKLRARIAGLCDVPEGAKPRPHLAIVLVGDNPRSKVYIEQKKKFGVAIGAEVSFFEYPEAMSTDELCNSLKEFGDRADIHGIILQLPLPVHFSKEDIGRILDIIPQNKDADGLTSMNCGFLMKESPLAIVPATARGVIELLKYYSIDVSGKHVVMVGRSQLVGKPIALSLLAMGATVTICHRGTTDLPSVTRLADILVSAVGVPGLITKEYVKEGQVIVDVGISVNGEGGISGDVNPNVVEAGIQALSPVPGGVGPMTVSGLFLNLMDLYDGQMGL